MKHVINQAILLFIIPFLLISPISQAKDSAIIIFDASGSMWGKINGKSKIEIARDVMGTLVNDWNEDIELGLMAYGHRKKGDCSDIELLQTISKPDSKKILSIIKRIAPKGKTPISESLKRAAKKLRYTEDPATVILISDGEENCNVDPCVISQELEKKGIYFTTHVIGFDIKNNNKARKQLQCIADNTGGLFYEAENAVNLKKALVQIKQEVHVPRKIIDLEGSWNAETTVDGSNGTNSGILTITQRGNYFTATSSTGGSTWVGTFDKEKNILKALFKKNDGSKGGNLVLNVSKDKKILRGKWTNLKGLTGTYIAKRN